MNSEERLGKLLSVNVSLPVTVPYGQKEVSTGIFKEPVAGEVAVTKRGLPGDGQADLVHHGGPDKAVCVYSFAHREHWENAWGKEMAYAAFGENFSVEGARETEVCVGDVIRAGTALFQVSQARLPCFKLGLKHGLPELPQEVQRTGYTGFYLRVLEEGAVRAGDELTLVSRHARRMTVAEAARIMLFGKQELAASERLLAIPELAESWKETLAERVAKLRAGQTEQGGEADA